MLNPGQTKIRNRQKEIIEHVKGRLRSGDLRSGDRLPTYAELMNNFSVTSNVVSRALLHLEHEGLLSREQGRGVFVAHKVKRTRRTIGLTVPPSVTRRTSYWERLIDGARGEAARQNADVLYLADVTEDGVGKTDGVVVFTGLSATALGLVQQRPNVAIFGESPRSVRIDDRQGGYDAACKLIGLGHKRIGWLAQTRSVVGKQRIAGYLSALWEAGISVDDGLFHDVCFGSDDWMELGKEGIRTLLDGIRGEPVTAVIAQNDLIAIGAVQGLTERGISVPHDVSIIGFDGSEEGSLVSPSITSMAIPLEEIGGHAVRVVIDMIDGGLDKSNFWYVWPLTFKQGASTGPPPK